uniref:Uncharacterized protein n=1 Tax=Vespula pensylvanica TaxID=30213 RepID=A0A834P9Z5_VESPE|nr:hypothetical protein H0235_002453 [Vespula pensylvanica]
MESRMAPRVDSRLPGAIVPIINYGFHAWPAGRHSSCRCCCSYCRCRYCSQAMLGTVGTFAEIVKSVLSRHENHQDGYGGNNSSRLRSEQ